MIGVLIVLLIPIIYFILSLQPVKEGAGAKKIIHIPTNVSTQEIGNLLEKNHLIKNSFTFPLFVTLKGADSLKAGKYMFTVGQSVGQIIDELAAGKIYNDSFTLVVPEGFTVEQIADRLASHGIVPSKEAFLTEADRGEFNYDFVKTIPKNKGMKHRLEGYLFPDTYEISKGFTPHEIIDLLLKQEQEIWNPEWDKKIKDLKLTRHQFLTLASIVEREVKVSKEQSLVAGILLNRMKIKMPLQVDATLQYIIGTQKDRITYEDLKINSPYNTYQVQGLPPGPISNPGKAAMDAVANAEKTNYLYYVTKKDGTGEHYFASTYNQHLSNIEKSKTNGK